jgi:predicted Fe-S protein YdhL (DUF1289 family)
VITPATLVAERAITALAAQQDLPSPCISVCRMSPATGLCEGCFRKLEEIAGWSRMGDEAKRAIWIEITQRLKAVQPVPTP